MRSTGWVTALDDCGLPQRLDRGGVVAELTEDRVSVLPDRRYTVGSMTPPGHDRGRQKLAQRADGGVDVDPAVTAGELLVLDDGSDVVELRVADAGVVGEALDLLERPLGCPRSDDLVECGS